MAFMAIFGLVIMPNKAEAQNKTFSQTDYNPTGTITDTGIDTMTAVFTKGYGRILFSTQIVRASGTMAGTAILEYRVDQNYAYKSDAGDTLTLTNSASQTVSWNKTVTARYWRIRIGGATTVSATCTAKAQTD